MEGEKFKLIFSGAEVEFLLGVMKDFKLIISEPKTPKIIRDVYKSIWTKLQNPEKHEEPRLLVSN